MIRTVITTFFLIILFNNNLFAQQITGTWYGKLKLPNQNIRINFNILMDNGVYITTMDSPDQGAFKIPTDKTNFKDNKLEIFLNSLMISFKGELINNKIKGVFTQSGNSFPLILTKEKIKADKLESRPQDPKKPYPYKSEEVVFKNKKAGNIKLYGTLTIPENVKNPPVVILISGSGPQNRNEEIKAFNHRPFLVLSDFLTRNGIAVLRYDDRGIEKSEGNFIGSTTADFATDTEAAVKFLKNKKDFNFSKIGLIGHSEGGLIASITASKNKSIDFVVLLAAPGVSGAEILETQSEKISKLSGVSPEIIAFNKGLTKKIHKIVSKSKTVNDVKTNLTGFFNKLTDTINAKYKPFINETTVNRIIKSYSDAWMLYFVKTNPEKYLQKISCPLLVLNGSKDIQVLPEINLNAIKKATKNNKNVTVKELKNQNHLFQTCITGNIDEYAKIEETFSPVTMNIIVDWIKKIK